MKNQRYHKEIKTATLFVICISIYIFLFATGRLPITVNAEGPKVEEVVQEEELRIEKHLVGSKDDIPEEIIPEEIISEEETIVEEVIEEEINAYIIESTAYCPTGNLCRDETVPVEGETIAGKYEWLGRQCNLYYCNEDGSIGELMGKYTFHDTGFGHDPDGDGIGSIQDGSRIDIFMEEYNRAKQWGIRNIYIEFLD